MKKNKRFTIGALVLLLSTSLYLFFNLNKVALKSDVVTIEYGEKLNFENKDILTTTDSKVLESLKIDQAAVDLETGKNYPKVGKYNLVVTYTEFFWEQSRNLTLVVADTKEPTFSEAPERIEIQIKDVEPDFTTYFEVEDLSEFELTIDTDLVAFGEEGIYDAQAIAVDNYGNQSSHNFKIVIEVEETTNMTVAVPKDPEKKQESIKEDRVTPTVKNGILLVNKKHPLPADYSPGEDSTAVEQLNQLIREMQRLGYDISDDYSGFRSFDYQKNLYERYVEKDGQEAADTYSARPGYSEHQTGLTFDLKHWDGSLVIKEAEAQWLAKNAANYGFIIRYQVGKEHITGYQAEPWHLRYIGEEAINIYNSSLTLEEYLGVEGGDYYDE